jgi:hypothetical protein
MGLPTCSIRALPEHHQLLRRIGRALVTQPELSEPLAALIEGVTQDVTRPSTAWDQRFEDVEQRLARLEAEAVLRSETQAVLPQRDTRNTPPQHSPPAVTRQPAPPTYTPRPPRPAAGKRKSPVVVTDDLRRQVHDLRASGMSRDAVAAKLEIGGSTVSRILDAPRPVG